MPSHRLSSARSERGQAAVELVATLPLVVILLALAWQAALAGHIAWAVTAAAGAAARAAAVGGDVEAAARAKVGEAADVEADGAGHVRVSVPVPTLVPSLRLGDATAEASFRPQDGS